MEGSLLDLVGIVPQIALAVVVAYIIIKRDESWRSDSAQRDEEWRKCFQDATERYERLVNDLKPILMAVTEALSRQATLLELKQEITREVREEIKKGLK